MARPGSGTGGPGPPFTAFLTRPQEQKSIVAMEGIMEALCKSGSLFEVPVPDYKQLKACRKEVCLLKELWDMIVMVSGGHGRGQPGPTGPGGGRGPRHQRGDMHAPCPLVVKVQQQVFWSMTEAPTGPQGGSLNDSVSLVLLDVCVSSADR